MNRLPELHAYITRGCTPPWDRLNAWIYQVLAEKFLKHLNAKPKTDDNAINLETELFDFLLYDCQKQLDEINTRHKQAQTFLNYYTQSAHRREQEKHILDFASILGQTKRGLREDKRALHRAFGKDAVLERYTNTVHEIEQKLSVTIELLSLHVRDITHQDVLLTFGARFLKNHREEGLFHKLCFYQGDQRINIAAFKALANIVHHCQTWGASITLPTDLTQAIYRYAADSHQPTWCQIDALTLLAHTAPDEFIGIARKNLALAAPGDQLFVRARTAIQLCRLAHQSADAAHLLLAFLVDPNPYVRQQIAAHLIDAPTSLIDKMLPTLLQKDDCPQVRARAALMIPELMRKEAVSPHLGEHLLSQLLTEEDEFALRTYLHCLPAFYLSLKQKANTTTDQSQHKQSAAHWFDQCQSILEKLLSAGEASKAHSEKVYHWCSNTLTHLWTQHYYEADYRYFKACIDKAPRGKRQRLRFIRDMPLSHLARVLSAVCTEQFGIDILKIKKNQILYIKDHKKGFRLWRWLYALGSPATNKRQNYPHSRGRHFFGHAYVASDQIAELSPTQVPGEPLYLDEAGGYRPFLPLLEQVLSSLDQGWPTRPIALYSVWGITTIRPPGGIWRRVKAKWQLSLNFKKIAKLRNWQPNSDFNPDAFIRALSALGFVIQHRGYSDDAMKACAALPAESQRATGLPNKFFSLVPFLDPELRYRFTDYFFSVYQNSLLHLSYFLAAISGLFFWQHIRRNLSIKQARSKIPLVIGGWGTRGKSGTERLKAALFNALGYSIFAKTTGCEAMFLHATNHGSLRELFLFRPYDKATIWEQGHVVKLASKLKCQVFLWECMGLTPRYVHILQHQWMHDDLSTITNCYPDHEDLQGPAGVDVTEVMMEFVPNNSELITSEETMKPFLVQAAQEKNSAFVSVNWLDAGLLTPDILNRFPYAEHPANISLILKLGKRLNLPEDFCLKEMADRVIPDLGVLKKYPTASVFQRRLTFINGMSANERLATLSNWSRMKMDTIQPETHPDVWLTTLINNRADRVSRSQVFAELIVQNLFADRHYLIGDNQQGFLQYVRTAWFSYHQGWKHILEKKDTVERVKRFTEYAKRCRIPTTTESISLRAQAAFKALGAPNDDRELIHQQLTMSENISTQSLHAMAPNLGKDTLNDLTGFLLDLHAQYHDYLNIVKKFETHLPDAELIQALDTVCWAWLEHKIKPIPNYHIPGPQLIETIAKDTPPGFENRCMGIQNIKGTGLDFVYCWQQWHRHYHLCDTILNGAPQAAQLAIGQLAESPQLNLLDREKVEETIAQTKNRAFAQSESIQAELSLIEKRLADLENARSTETLRFSWLTRIINSIEAFLDAGAAIKRRKLADRIYEDLSHTRISHERAAYELKRLTQNQKGGWLIARVVQQWPFLRAQNTR